MARRRASLAGSRCQPLYALHAMWDYEDRQNGRGRYAPPRHDRRPRHAAMRSLVEALALMAAWSVVLHAVASG
jgi:hypothetical protein